MIGEQWRQPICELARLIRAKEISPVELTEHFLERIDAFDGSLHSFVHVAHDFAMARAWHAENEIMAGHYRGKLHGIPFALKDIYDTKGIPTTAQSRALASNIPARDATVVDRLYAAGAILLGKNATHEFTHGNPSQDDVFPPARNPWNLENDPEGSSSGSAAAVAAGLATFSMGSDTGGSIREPAAGCGVVGLKPTFGRVSSYGVIPNSFSHDHCGPLAWTVEDCAIVLAVIAGTDPLCHSSSMEPVPDYAAALGESVSGFRIGIPRNWFEREIRASEDVRTAFEESVRVFRDLGAELCEVVLPPLQDYADAKKIIAMAELFAVHSDDLRNRPHLLGRSLRYLITCGGLITAEEYIQASRWRLKLCRAMGEAFSEIDVMILPTMAAASGKLVAIDNSRFLSGERSYTTPFNVSGYPAVSICNGFDAASMPMALQIAGRPFKEDLLLRLAHAYESATGWRKLRPKFFDRSSANNMALHTLQQ